MTHSTVGAHCELRSPCLKEDERTVMSHLIGCFESWTSTCRERVLERFSPWRKGKTFKLPNKLFQVFISKNREIKKKKSSTGNKVRLKGYTVIYHQGLYSLGHFAVMLEVSRIPSAYDVQKSKSKKRKLLP